MKILSLIFTIILSTAFLQAETYYVDATTGNDNNDGISLQNPWESLNKILKTDLQPGDSVLLKRGQSWNGKLDINASSDGTANYPVVISSYGTGAAPLLFEMEIKADYVVVENLNFDHKKQGGDCIELTSAENCTLRNLNIINGTSDAIDISKSHNVLIENCEIAFFLNGSFANQVDAHGIVATDTRGITIRNCNIHHNSGDSFQTDPDRDDDTPNDILIENCRLWTGPLDEDFNSGWQKGDIPGENAIDTKLVKDNWENIDRMRIVIRNTEAYGWRGGNISNMAAFNMKEKIEAVFEGVTVYDSEIAFRLRGTRGNANVTIINGVVFNCEKAFRAEDDLSNLKIFNSTFGKGNRNVFTFAGGDDGLPSWQLLNNAFTGEVPSEASDASNKSAGMEDFLNLDKHDYHLKETSGLIDEGKELENITSDRDGKERPSGAGYDIGAYEFQAEVTALLNDERMAARFELLQNYPNPFNPWTTIMYTIAEKGFVDLSIYDIAGRKIKTLVSAEKTPGSYSIKFNSEALSSGIYFYTLRTGDALQTKRMTLLK